MKLKQKEIPALREMLLKEQEGLCLLCRRTITEDPVLDHDHTMGHVRGVLHRTCNGAEGRVLNWARRAMKENPAEFLTLVQDYWSKDYSDNPLHPNFKTKTDKRIKLLRKRMKKAKLASTRERIKREIKELKAQEKS